MNERFRRRWTKRIIVLVAVMLLTCVVQPLTAQEEGVTQAGVSYGGQVSGEISRANPRAVYTFDGLRGEVISIRLRAVNGDLDPTLTVMDASGAILINRDDTDGSRDAIIEALTIPTSDRYFIVVSRFGSAMGSTAGTFALEVERIGVSSASGSALRYGDAVINNITHLAPQVYYSFRASRGDIVDIQMLRDSGNLDPYLQVVDSNAFVVADNDDLAGSGSLDAAIKALVIEKTGTYVIVATRYGEANGTSTGRFILKLDEAANSGLGNAAQTAVPLAFGGFAESEINDDNVLKYYAFDARQNDLITVRMTRTSGTLDAYLTLLDEGMLEMISNDDSSGGQNAAIEGFLIPRDGRYYVIATRMDRQDGTTSGSYRIELQTLGNAFDGIPPEVQRISYGTTITGRIDDTTTEVLFAFWGTKGDVMTTSLNRGDGDLDPVVQILNSEGAILDEDDDSGGGQNARIGRYVLSRTGIYLIRATRFNGTDGNPFTRGSFILVLARLLR